MGAGLRVVEVTHPGCSLSGRWAGEHPTSTIISTSITIIVNINTVGLLHLPDRPVGCSRRDPVNIYFGLDTQHRLVIGLTLGRHLDSCRAHDAAAAARWR